VKALVIDAPNQLEVREVAPLDLGERDVLVRMRRVGICHSDLDLLAGNYILPLSFPVTPGHEWVGEVAEVGAGVRGFAPGDRVVGECAVTDTEHFGFTVNGALAESFRAQADWLHKIPDSLDDALGALVEPFTVAYAGTKGIDSSDDVVVFGAGPIGLCAVVAASQRGGRVILVEPAAERRDLGIQLGASEALDPTTGRLVDEVRRLTGSRMATHVVEASGNPQAMAAALEVAGFGAQVTNIGIYTGGAIRARLGLVVESSLRIRGQVGSAGVWPAAIRFLSRIDIDLSAIVSRRFGLDRAVEAFDVAAQRSGDIKVHVANE
jgi:threonine dehydrogenase-like Zn-dependent dehydrogenase